MSLNFRVFRSRLVLLFGVVLINAGFVTVGYAQELLYSQPPTTGAGVTWNSSFWVDPFDQNDSDNDSIAWEDFTLDHQVMVTRVRWWGEPKPSLGFKISFFNQDPNTAAIQPDIFGAKPTGAFVEESFPNPTVQGGGGQTMFTVDLSEPILLEANTRYFVSVLGLTPAPYPNWGWVASDTNISGTFYWIRGAHMFWHLPHDRAVELYGECLNCPAPCISDLNGDGELDFLDISAFLSAYSNMTTIADLNGDGQYDFLDISMFLATYSAGCP